MKLHEIELPAIRAAHEEGGPGIELTLDVNCSLTLNEVSHFYDEPGLLAAILATAALGKAGSMIEWCWFDLEAQIYGAARGRNSAGLRYRGDRTSEAILIPTRSASTLGNRAMRAAYEIIEHSYDVVIVGAGGPRQ